MRHRDELDDMRLDSTIFTLVRSVGQSYGRGMMHGVLHSCGFRVNQSRVAASLQRIAPFQHSARQRSTHQLLNPLPYQAHYFGDKLHLDQNEKCVMFGVTHVVAIDGYSRKIVGFNPQEKEEFKCGWIADRSTSSCEEESYLENGMHNML